MTITPLCPETEKLLRPIRLSEDDRLRIGYLVDAGRFVYTPYSTSEDPFARPSWNASYHWFRRLPERKDLHDGSWEVACTDFNVIITHVLWGDRVTFQSDLAKQQYQYLLGRFFALDASAKMKADYLVQGVVPEAPRGFVDHAEHPLADYQLAGLVSSLGQEASALFMEQGTGKTPMVLRRICHEAKRVHAETGKMYRAVVVCPKNVRSNWAIEAQKFATTRGQYVVLRGGSLKRMKLLVDAFTPQGEDVQWTLVIVSYETLVRSWEQFKIIEWHLGVLDESHKIKSMYAQRTKHMHRFRDMCQQRMVLTGTPICNTLLDLFGQLEFLGEGMSGFRNWKNFKHFYCRTERSRDGRFEKITGFKNIPILKERLARVAFQIDKKRALPDLPEKTYDVVEVSMTPKQREYYVSLARKLMIEVEEMLERAENKQLTVTNILTKLLRLAQITSGHIRWDESEASEQITPNPKIEALVELLREKGPHQKTVVWATFVPDVLAIHKRLNAEGIKTVMFYGSTKEEDRESAVRDFNCDPSVRVFVGNPAAGGVGINLWGYDASNGEFGFTFRDTWRALDLELKTRITNCDHVVYFSQNWSMPDRTQSEDRCHRRGTRQHVQYTDLVIPGTIDEEIRARVTGKRNRAMNVRDVRELLGVLVNVGEV